MMGIPKHITGKKYQYRNQFVLTINPIVFLYVAWPLLILNALIVILELILGQFVSDYDSLTQVVILIPLVFFFPIEMPTIMNIHPILVISDDQLWVRIFTWRYKWVGIPWNEIRSISKTTINYHGNKLYSIAITKELTIFHRKVSKRLKLENSHYIFFRDLLIASKGFIAEIEEKIEQNNPYPSPTSRS